MPRLKLNLKDNLLASDTESTGIVTYGDKKRWGFEPARPFAFSFCDSQGNTDYIRWPVDPKTRKVLPVPRELEALKELYGNPHLTHVGHNFGFDLRMLEATGIHITGRIEDTLIMAHVVTGGDELTYALKPLAIKYLNIPDDDETVLQEATHKARAEFKRKGYPVANKDMFGREPIKADYWMAPGEICKAYAVRDAQRTMMFYLTLYPELQANPQLMGIYQKEIRLSYVVRAMEARGVRVFPEDLVSLEKFYTEYMDKQMALADANGGKGLNFRSYKQMTQKFFVERKYTPKSLTKCGNPKLDGEILAELASKDPLAKAILEFRGAGHMISAFLNPYARHRVQESSGAWVLHPSYRQCGPVTGRFSCGDPNLMQVASETTGRRKTEITLRPREAFGPRDGYLLYLPDYSQIEIWVFSFLAQEEAMMTALLSGHDFHSTVSERVWKNEPDYKERKSYYRKRAKLLMFCKLYGGGTRKIAWLMECAPEEAQKFVDQYDEELPGVQRFMKRMINMATREGKVVNPFGRHYFIKPDFAYRAVNYLVQGTCADIMKSAMLNVDSLFQKKWKGCHILLTLHDELMIEVPKQLHSKSLMRDIIKAMQGDFHMKVNCPVPLPISVKIATHRWSKTTEIEL